MVIVGVGIVLLGVGERVWVTLGEGLPKVCVEEMLLARSELVGVEIVVGVAVVELTVGACVFTVGVGVGFCIVGIGVAVGF